MTSKLRKTGRKRARARRGRIGRLYGSVEDELLALAKSKGGDPRWNRPRKKKISLYLDSEVLEWLKSKGRGYQTRINRILRRVMAEGKRQEAGTSKTQVRQAARATDAGERWGDE